MEATGPRIAPLPPGEWDDRQSRLLERLPGGRQAPLHIFATLARADDELFRRWLGFGGALLAGNLHGRLRELVVLRTAHRFGGRYEWAQHVRLGEAEGISRDEMAVLGDGDGRGLDAVAWSPLERAALAAVDETADAGAVSDATWAVLSTELGESELIELLLLIAHYLMLTSVLRSLQIEVEPWAEALAAGVPGGPAAAAGAG